MNEMLKVNMRQNLQVVVQIATKYSDLLGPVKLIEMFEQYKTFDGECALSPGFDTSLIFLSRQVFTTILDRSSTSVRTRRSTSSTSRPPPEPVKFERSSVFAERATTTIPRRSRTS